MSYSIAAVDSPTGLGAHIATATITGDFHHILAGITVMAI